LKAVFDYTEQSTLDCCEAQNPVARSLTLSVSLNLARSPHSGVTVCW